MKDKRSRGGKSTDGHKGNSKTSDGHKIGKSKSADGHKIGKSKTGKPSFKSKNKSDGKKSHPTKSFKKKTFASKKNIIKPKSVPQNEKERDTSEVTLKRKKTMPQKDENQKDDSVQTKKHKSETITELMTIYETLRRKKSSSNEKETLIDRVMKIVAAKGSEVLYKHDSVRVIEMCVKFGSSSQKDELFKLFEANLIQLVTSKYGKFLAEKFIEYGSKDQKKKIVEAFYGKVKKLIRHKDASSVVDEIYDKYANSSQRASLVEEFYGPEFRIFKLASGRTLEDILQNEPAKKESVMKYMKESFDILCQKDVVVHSIIHKALFDFFKYASPQQKTDVIEVLKEKVVNILHTKDGAKVAMNCLWYGTAKDRKLVIKSFKTFVTKICKEEYGHLVLLALFDVVDDTVLAKKALFTEITENLKDLMVNQYGRKVILYLLKPRSPSYFNPDTLKMLQQGDKNKHSKKDSSVRYEELRNAILPDLLDSLLTHVKDIISNKSASIVFLAALDVSGGMPKSESLLHKLAELAGKPFKVTDELEKEITTDLKPHDTDSHPINDACGHWVIKNVIRQDKTRIENGNDVLFSKVLCDVVPEGCFADWASSNRGAFVLVSLLESEIDSVTSRVKEDLKFLEKDKLEESKGLVILKKLLSE